MHILKKGLFLWFISIISLVSYSEAQDPVTYHSTDIYMQLKKLNVLGSVLYIAAHPDDENNSFLPYLAKEKLYRTAYLSLTRGDGGQNLIGSEQGIELGLIRTQELLAARRIDGAEQYFSRAYEFGFSKSTEEALRIWDREKVLSDVVWMIRKFQPDIIITRFPGDKRAGHGHHSASSVIAQEAYIAAADPKKFPEQFNYGVKPWQPKRILWNTFNFGATNTTSNDQFKIEVGGYNSLIGKSYGELGGEARTMHKSQGEGRPRRRGEAFEFFQTLGGDTPKVDLMDGIIIDWKRITGGEKIQSQINAILKNYQFEKPEKSVSALVALYRDIKLLPDGNWKEKKLAETQQLIEACTALFTEATTNQENILQGGNLNVNFFFNKRKEVNATVTNIHLENFDSSFSTPLLANSNVSINKTLVVDVNKKISQPYWLEFPKAEGVFDVRNQLMIGKAENDASFEAIYTVTIEGETIIIKRPVQYKVVDLAKGELYQPLVVLPKTEVNFSSDNFVSLNGAPIQVHVHSNNSIQGAKMDIKTSATKNFSLQKTNPTIAVNSINQSSETFFEYLPLTKKENYKEELEIATSNKEIFAGSSKVISYDHIPTITYFAPAKVNLVKLDVKTVGKKVGYIIGAGDKVPQAIEQLGYEITYLNEEDLTDESLKKFDVIITGVRAYNIFEYLTNKNDLINKFVENGGNLIIQYIKSNQVGLKRIKAGPYPFTVSTGNRVTEENASVTFLLPQHALLNYPNKITAEDFVGWTQERSTYQADQMDPHFEALLSMHDTGEKESNGSLLTAKYGKGNVSYVSLVLFRQLPAGVPGAYRLLANLIALNSNK